ncbi:MAG: hypothetical protein HC871_14850, partial [Rhizobiales bacterium]|nr:hypothetical protein [Hyphomicrobiales bacterium]
DDLALISGGGAAWIENGMVVYDPGQAYDHLAVGETATVTLSYRVTNAAGLSDDASVTITVRGSNDRPVLSVPLADQAIAEDSTYRYTIPENAFADVDASDVLTFEATLADGSPLPAWLHFDAASRTFSGIPLNDHVGTLEVRVTATDGHGGTASDGFSLEIRNTNDLPADVTLAAGGTVVENAANGTLVGQISASDVDAGDVLRYSLADDAGGRFAIDAVSGEITVADGSLLDFEDASAHEVTVRVTDADGAFSDQTVTLNLADVNETPTGIALAAGGTVAENAAHGTLVGEVSGSDQDAGETLAYSLVDDAGGRFAIDAASGAITVADGALLDYEAASSHDVTVRVTDADGASHDQTFTLNIADVNETPTGIALSAGGTVAENAANGTLVGQVTGSDVDAGDVLSYSLVDDAGGRFAIDSASGEITVADGSLLDYEAASSHDVTVRVTDADGASHDQTFTLNLADANDRPDDLTLVSGGTVSEVAANGTLVGTVSGNDQDAGEVLSYSLADDAGGRFTIDASSGQITVADASLLDYEAASFHRVSVRVTDSGGSTYDESVTLNVTDNANPDSITGVAPVGTVRIGVYDIDKGAAAAYAADAVNEFGGELVLIDELSPDTLASIDVLLAFNPSNSGWGAAYAAALADLEAAVDNGLHLVLHDRSVTDVAKMVPGLGGVTHVRDIDKDSADVEVVADGGGFAVGDHGTVTDSTLDLGDHSSHGFVDAGSLPADAEILMTRSDPAEAVTFRLALGSGSVTYSTIPLDYYLADDGKALHHDMEIYAQNLVEDLVDTYDLLDVAVPDFTSRISEAAETGERVITIAAEDPDGQGVSFSLDDDAGGRFAIDAASGVVTVADAALLDYETISSHTITVRVTDGDGEFTTQDVTIEVLDAATNLALSSDVVAEHAVSGSVVGVVSDSEGGVPVVAYELIDDAGGFFAIDAASGVLSVTDGTNLDHEAAASHDVTVRVTTSDGATSDKIFTIHVADVADPVTHLGTDSAESLSGSADADYLVGLAGGDVVRGGAGDDILDGDDGDDHLYGGEGDDLVFGGAGSDRLYADAEGTDVYDGGDGDDTFVLEGDQVADATFVGGAGTDTIELDGQLIGVTNLQFTDVELIDNSEDSTITLAAGGTLDLSGLTVSAGTLEIHGGGGGETVTGSESGDDFHLDGSADRPNEKGLGLITYVQWLGSWLDLFLTPLLALAAAACLSSGPSLAQTWLGDPRQIGIEVPVPNGTGG